ncbi:MAG: substrate-binding domain-containing protein [Tannerella sp.]|jgi:LacI family transcriptional regulator|nr:substrate-binding domain-containing protein [Tannerella sp.]
MKEMNNYRIKDIAAMAGVSVGTVDRVLHERGRVSEDALKKVKKALKELDYQPNLIARSLASKKAWRILVLMPSFEPGEYWSEVSKGFDKVEREFSIYHLQIERRFFNQYDRRSFDILTTDIKKEECQGVIIATLFSNSTFKFSQWLDRKNIPYVFIDSYIDNTNCIAYYGTDSYKSGYIGGRLLYESIHPDDDVLLFNILSRRRIESTQVSMREKGFHDYLSQSGYRGSLYSLSLSTGKTERNRYILDSFFSRAANRGRPVRAGIIFNSRVHVAAKYFRENRRDDFFLIGYDAIEANTHFLKTGTVSHLIAQRPEVQGYNSVRALFHYLALKQTGGKVNYMPIDILIKENIDYYNNYI